MACGDREDRVQVSIMGMVYPWLGGWVLKISEATTHLPLFDVVPQVLELFKAQLACGVTLAGDG
jgi:hypothetical protein